MDFLKSIRLFLVQFVFLCVKILRFGIVLLAVTRFRRTNVKICTFQIWDHIDQRTKELFANVHALGLHAQRIQNLF